MSRQQNSRWINFSSGQCYTRVALGCKGLGIIFAVTIKKPDMSWTCPKCDRELPWNNYRHYCKRVDLDSLFVGRSADLILAFDKILAEVAGWPEVLIGVTPNCIVFTKKVGFLILKPMKKELDIKFYSALVHAEKPVIKSIPLGKKFENHIRISSAEDVRPELFVYLWESYKIQ